MDQDNKHLVSLIQKLSRRCSYHSDDLDGAVREIGNQADMLNTLAGDLSLLVWSLANATRPMAAKALSDKEDDAWLSLEVNGLITTNYNALGAMAGVCVTLVCLVLLLVFAWNCTHHQKMKKLAKVGMVTTKTDDNTCNVGTIGS